MFVAKINYKMLSYHAMQMKGEEYKEEKKKR